jgi:hypothetical protein
LIDWLLTLPQELEVAFREDLIKFERERTMPYVTSIERLGREEGRQEGRQEASANLAVRLKFVCPHSSAFTCEQRYRRRIMAGEYRSTGIPEFS